MELTISTKATRGGELGRLARAQLSRAAVQFTSRSVGHGDALGFR